jgi:hypothetical protein
MRTYLICILLPLFVLSCNSDNPADKNDNTTEKGISALINDTHFASNDVSIQKQLGTHNILLGIEGIDHEDTLKILLYFDPGDTIKTGTYSLDVSTKHLGIYHHGNEIDTASEGEVYLEAFDENYPIKAAGIFNFIIKENSVTKYSITNGYFNSGDF